MEFYIKKNATLPVLKMQVVKDGRSDYNKMMEMIEEASIFFSMVDTETGIPRIVTRPAGFVEKKLLDPNAEYEYYVYYQFTPNDTRKVGRYEGQFLLRNSDGTLILPIREKLYINVQESFIADDLPYESCYVVDFPCCASIPTTTTTTTTPCPTCRPCCPPETTTTTSPIEPTLVLIRVTPEDQSILIGDQLQMTATGTYSDGSTQDITDISDWGSLNPLIASVNNTTNKGLVDGVSAGLTLVGASLNNVQEGTNVNVFGNLTTTTTQG